MRWLPALLLVASTVQAQSRPRARDLGVPFDGTPGPLNAITDVAGVTVGHATIIKGEGRLVVGQGPVRTGVTAIFPRGATNGDPVFGGWFTLNGNGEMTGTTWLEESGFLAGPVMITNTHSVGVVRGALNDINGFHVTKENVFAALDSARGGAVAEGNVGGGTGMICNQFKGGIGTASRRLPTTSGGYTVGVLVQCNYGSRARLSIAGVPVGQEIPDLLPCRDSIPGVARPGGARRCEDAERGSIIIVIATDAPLLPHQLKRIAKRASLGVGRLGGLGGNPSGDIFVAFSTANPGAAKPEANVSDTMLPNERITPLFEATVQATEEAIVNAMVAAETMTGSNGLRVYALPHDRLRAALRKYNRLIEPRR